MILRAITSLLCCIFIYVADVSADSPTLLPSPRSYVTYDDCYLLSADATVGYTCDILAPAAGYLCEHMSLMVGDALDSDIRLSVDTTLAAEDYRLVVADDGVTIYGGGYGGVFNGITTLFELLPAEVYSHNLSYPVTIGCCTVDDGPRFSYRGFMLDVCRTWIDKEAVKEYIELLAYHKINHLRLHLTDDEAWRIEIKSHPELAEVGGFRGGDSPIWPRYGKWTERWGGYYTQDDMRDIIEFARIRNICIVPEIDLPGHSLCIATLHPEILCRYTPSTESSLGYDDRTAFCAAREANYELLDDILGEVCRLFPSEYIHIGGDEVDMSQWRRCPDCMALMRRMSLDSEAALQSHFMSRLNDIVARYGKRAAVWNEAVEGGTLPSDTRVYGWESVAACRSVAAEGYPTIVVPGEYFYFDMKQSPREPGHDWAAIFDLRKVYEFSLRGVGFSDAEIESVEGFEATFFSELYASHTPERADYLHYQTFPRLLSFASVAWCHSEERSWDAFYSAVRAHYRRMDAMGVAYRLMPPVVSYADGHLSVAVDDGSDIYYRREPMTVEMLYRGPIATTAPEEYSFISRRDSGAHSPVVAVAKHFKVSHPRYSITSSMGCSERFSFSAAEGYGRLARTSRAAGVGDWIMFTFADAVDCRMMTVATGNFQLPRYIIEQGYVEVSYDGTTFEYAGVLDCGMFSISYPKHPIKAVRITSTSEGNGARWVSVQPPVVYPKQR